MKPRFAPHMSNCRIDPEYDSTSASTQRAHSRTDVLGLRFSARKTGQSVAQVIVTLDVLHFCRQNRPWHNPARTRASWPYSRSA